METLLVAVVLLIIAIAILLALFKSPQRHSQGHPPQREQWPRHDPPRFHQGTRQDNYGNRSGDGLQQFFTGLGFAAFAFILLAAGIYLGVIAG